MLLKMSYVMCVNWMLSYLHQNDIKFHRLRLQFTENPEMLLNDFNATHLIPFTISNGHIFTTTMWFGSTITLYQPHIILVLIYFSSTSFIQIKMQLTAHTQREAYVLFCLFVCVCWYGYTHTLGITYKRVCGDVFKIYFG